tara:strand:- start:1216 stop:2118 length:903 start_codon:yes stop_codon:yes gene_type:complete
MEEDTQGNPKAVEDTVFGSDGDDFFTALENDVNGGIQENNVQNVQNEATSVQQSPNKVEQSVQQVSQGSEESSELDNLKKRYSDSSREAQRMRAQLNELKPYVPVLQAMKKDSGLVNHVRDYLQEGGSVPKNIKEQLRLDEDFEFDMDDVVNKPDSDSAKAFHTMVDGVAAKRVNETVAVQEKQKAQAEYKAGLQRNAAEFMQKNGLTPQEFKTFVQNAQEKFQTEGMTFEDMYMIVNKGKVNQNVANATKNDMLNQMKNVREIPTTASSANNAGQINNVNDNVFDALLNSDGNIEELLG